MNIIKDYKGMLFIFLIITVINVFWVVNEPNKIEDRQVKNELSVVLND